MKRALVITGSSRERQRRLIDVLEENASSLSLLSISGEPEIHEIDDFAETARSFEPDVVVAIGGGSVIDTAKALSALVCNEGSAIDYIEGVGRGRIFHSPGPPLLALPATAGSGAEVTRNVLSSL